MTLLLPSQAEEHLSQVAQQFAQWRQNRANPRGSRIPEALWVEAIALAEVLPLTQVARHLGLKPHALQQRRGDHGRPPGTPRPSQSPAFVEVTSEPRQLAATEVELQRPDGACLRIRYPEAAPCNRARIGVVDRAKRERAVRRAFSADRGSCGEQLEIGRLRSETQGRCRLEPTP
jgi:hypothetical protein